MDRAKAAGALVVHTVGTPEEARRSIDLGVDILVAQGNEAGGHVWSRLSTMVSLVADVAGKVPVLAAGGIADGRGLAAALMLGASGVWIGTRFLASTEAACHADYKRRLIEAAASETIETTLFDGGWPDAPSRVLRNRAVEAWAAAGRPKSGSRPGEGEEIGRTPDGKPVCRYSFASLLSGSQGISTTSPFTPASPSDWCVRFYRRLTLSDPWSRMQHRSWRSDPGIAAVARQRTEGWSSCRRWRLRTNLAAWIYGSHNGCARG
ncbi:NAD(P)H-dependent flavin oxidoreductase [Rhizobium leguminosarum]|uniref:NAD(P)H-dependent flavin oxidoreductase n=1 Tax=Rhizobium leguminosarum TaxID=384 RepID=UPI003F9CE969